MQMSRGDEALSRVAPSRSTRGESIGLAAVILIVGWLYSYIGIPPIYKFSFERESLDYYHQLTDGFLAGRLGFRNDPPPELVALADPYDPVQRAQAGNVGAHDATYYQGRYYLYFGVAPAVTLFLPFKLLTGLHFPQNLATVLFCFGGYVASVVLLSGLRRRFFPELGSWVFVGATLVLGLGNLCLPMLARNSVWELPISGAYFFSSWGFVALFRGLGEQRYRVHWLALASGLFGLAMASRPHFALGAVFLCGFWAVPWLKAQRRAGFTPDPAAYREAMAVVLPVMAIGLGLLVYNNQRFGDPFEFGQKYQLSGNRQVDSDLVSPRFVPINLYFNFIAAAQLERYFPFVQVVENYPGRRPADYGGAENPYGVLPNLPICWFAIAFPLIWLRGRQRHAEVGRWFALLGGFFLAVAGAVLCFAWSANRYIVDFLPSLLLLAILAGFMVVAGLRPTSAGSAWRRVSACVFLIFAAATAGFNVLLAVQHNDLFKQYRPNTFQSLATVFDAPALRWEEIVGQEFGPAELQLRLPLDQTDTAEPLVVAGVGYKADYVYVLYYPGARRIRIAFNHTGGAQILSQPIPIDFQETHRIGIQMGSLYPARGHPYFRHWPPDRIEDAKLTLRVSVNGVPYLDEKLEFYDVSPGSIRFGENQVSSLIGKQFTGSIIAVTRNDGQQKQPPTESDHSFVRLALQFPAGAGGGGEPLLSTGAAGETDSLFVEYLGPKSVRLGFLHEGGEPIFSRVIPIEHGSVHVFEVSFGSFYAAPKSTRELELSRSLVVLMDGQTIWTAPADFHARSSGPVLVGRIASTQSAIRETFSGVVKGQDFSRPYSLGLYRPFDFKPYWMESSAGASDGPMRIHFKLPSIRPTRIEPLIVSGTSELLSDYVIINHVPAGRVILGTIHATSAGPQSSAIPVDPTRTQLAEFDLPFLYPAETSDYFAAWSLKEIADTKRGLARIRLNGRLLFDAPISHFDLGPEALSIGTNPFIQAYGKAFSGEIVAVERRSDRIPEGMTENSGPIQLTLQLPARSEPGTVEALLATGRESSFDVLTLTYTRPGWARLGVRTAAGIILAGNEFPYDEKPVELTIQWGGLAEDRDSGPPAGSGSTGARQSVHVSRGGNLLLEGSADFSPSRPLSVHVGSDPTDAERSFSGIIRSIRRRP
jgi:hypothetical protein